MPINSFGTKELQVASSLACLLAVAGCAGEDPARDAVTSVESAVITHQRFQDATGTILVSVKTCDWTTSKTTNCSYCIVEDGYTRVGGGAEIEGEATPGARIIASRPDWSSGTTPHAPCTGEPGKGASVQVDTWVARSIGPTAHRLRSYVVGLRIKNDDGTFAAPAGSGPADRLQHNVAPPGEATAVAASDALNIGHVIIGGGAEIVPIPELGGANAFITETRPVFSNGEVVWQSRARMQQPTPIGGVKTWVVGIDSCPPGWNGDCFVTAIRNKAGTTASGYGTVSDSVANSWAFASIGGRADSSGGGGRSLADLIPLNGAGKGLTVRSMYNGSANSARTHSSVLQVGRQTALYRFNSVRFHRNSTTLYRPSGTDPVLQESTLVGDALPARWNLEGRPELGAGIYLLRNGNPDSGGECAYRQTGSTVRVKPCGTTNEFRWTVHSGNPSGGNFRLRNVAANQCLDTPRTGFQSGNLVLTTCSAPDAGSASESQLLFLDRYNFPPAP